MEITLSYVLTTFNKLKYLRVTLPYLLEECGADEEIIITDGGSTDGTVDFLNDLFRQKKIHQLISEKDFGEAHGLNKGILLAKGKLIKVITDDDIFYFPALIKCKEFMLSNPHVDVLGFDGFGYNLSMPGEKFIASRFIDGFKNWQVTRKPFIFCGLSLMLRKNSLAYLGLFNPKFKIVDLEYTFRISSFKSSIAFYTGPGFVNIVGPDSNSIKMEEIIEEERFLVNQMYLPRKLPINWRKAMKVTIQGLLAIRAGLMGKKLPTVLPDFDEVVRRSVEYLHTSNSSAAHEIIVNKK